MLIACRFGATSGAVARCSGREHTLIRGCLVVRLRGLWLFALLLAGCAWPAAAHAVVYGASVGGDFAYLARGTWTLDQVRTSLENLHAAGATVARADVDWARAEPHGPVDSHYHYDWRHDDLVAGALAAAHLHWDA